MKLGIMQPYFFPYLGYFQLIQSVDKWVSFDVVQYIRHGWVNRNRVLHPSCGWQYIIAPVQKHSRDSLISDVRVVTGNNWKERILGQLTHYKKRAKYYQETSDFIRDCLFSFDDLNLTNLNTYIMYLICKRYNIEFDYSIASQLKLDFSSVLGPGDWALETATQMGAEVYVNPPGGRHLFDVAAFSARGIDLKFLQPGLRPYNQRSGTFENGLSIIDVMMFNDDTEIADRIKEGVIE